jgi:superoxide dismutase, Cu-Zn family
MRGGSRRGSAGGRWWWLLVLVVPVGFASMWMWVAVAGAGPTREVATLHDLSGNVVGRAILSPGSSGGTFFRFSVHGLSAGFHAFHVHANGLCDAQTGYASVGGHYDHLHRQQPFDGDLPVILVGADGRARARS